MKRAILYIGSDEKFWYQIKFRYQAIYPDTEFDFQIYTHTVQDCYHEAFLWILNSPPKIIYIDFSTEVSAKRKLARMLHRENLTTSIPLIALVPDKAAIKNALISGISSTHIKCGEVHDVVYDGYYVAFPKDVVHPEFARAEFARDVELKHDFRVGYLTPDFLHAEGSLYVGAGDTLDLQLNISKELLPSSQFVVEKVSDENLYYDHLYSYDLRYEFVDRVLDTDDESLVGKRQLKVETVKTRFTEWIKERSHKSTPKKTKILLIDKKASVLKIPGINLDNTPYSVRFQTELTEDIDRIKQTMPGIIAFEFHKKEIPEVEVLEDGDEALAPADTETIDKENDQENDQAEEAPEVDQLAEIKLITEKIHSIKNYHPILIVFNLKSHSSAELQKLLNYPLIIAKAKRTLFAEILDLAEVYEKKIEEQEQRKRIAMLREAKSDKKIIEKTITPKFYIKKTDDLSFVSAHLNVRLRSMSESILTFSSERKLYPNSVYRINFPVDMSITLVPNENNEFYKKDGNIYIYTGLIHSVDEDDKKKLRKFVYDIFTSAKKEAEEKEAEAFRQLNEKVLSEKYQKYLDQRNLKSGATAAEAEFKKMVEKKREKE